MDDDFDDPDMPTPPKSPSRLPPGECITTVWKLAPNRDFTGREDEMESIHKYLTSESSRNKNPTLVVIHGHGGQGKTQTPLGYYWKYRDSYDAVFWIDSETKYKVDESFDLMAEALARVNEIKGFLPWAARSHKWLQEPDKKWLLILDNLNDVGLMEAFLPSNPSGVGSIIITTQEAHMSPITDEFHKLELQPLSEDSAASLFFYQVLGRPALDTREKDTVNKICQWAGGLPPAIVHAARYMVAEKHSVHHFGLGMFRFPPDMEPYVECCSEAGIVDMMDCFLRSPSMRTKIEHPINKDDYCKESLTMFYTAFKGLSRHSRHLLCLLAFLGPAGVPDWFLAQVLALDSVKLSKEDEYQSILQDLVQRQLVVVTQQDPGNDDAGTRIRINKALQLGILRYIAHEKRPFIQYGLFKQVLDMLDSVRPKTSPLPETAKELWLIFHKYADLVMGFHQSVQWLFLMICRCRLDLPLRLATTLSKIMPYLLQTGQISQAIAVFDTVQSILRNQRLATTLAPEFQSLQNEALLAARILTDHIGVSRRRFYRRKSVLGFCERKLAFVPLDKFPIQEKTLICNLQFHRFCAHLERHKFNKTSEILEHIIPHYNDGGIEAEHPHVLLRYYLYLSEVYKAEGNLQKTAELDRKFADLRSWESFYYQDEVFVSERYDLACVAFNAGLVDEALVQHQQVLEWSTKRFGWESRYTFESCETLGALLYLTGKYNESLFQFEMRLTHPDLEEHCTTERIARAQFWYSRVLERLGRHEEVAKELASAAEVKNQYLRDYAEFLQDDPNDDPAAVYDKMVLISTMQTLGPLFGDGEKQEEANEDGGKREEAKGVKRKRADQKAEETEETEKTEVNHAKHD